VPVESTTRSPKFALYSVIVTNAFILIAMSIGVLQIIRNPSSTGLRVRLLHPKVTTVSIGGIQPLRIQIRFINRDTRPMLYLNSQPIPWKNLTATLEIELSRRPPDWPVYLESDREIEWENAAKAIDIIRGLHTEVVLLTSGAAQPRDNQQVRQ
jgi:hypothetical protein